MNQIYSFKQFLINRYDKYKEILNNCLVDYDSKNRFNLKHLSLTKFFIDFHFKMKLGFHEYQETQEK